MPQPISSAQQNEGSLAAKLAHRSKYTARRIVQTPRVFSNWPAVLSDMARGKLGGGPKTLTFTTRSGLTISCPNVPGARLPIYETFADDGYQVERLLAPLLDHPVTVVDIGAHIGTFSCRVAQLHPQANVFSFEPSPTTAEFCQLNAKQNGFADRVTVFERAVTDRTGMTLFMEDSASGSSQNYLLDGEGDSATPKGTEVTSISFDDIVEKATAPVELVKIDCEGSEYDFVPASAPDSWANVQRIVMEYHPITGKSWPELRGWFEDLGFHVVRDDTEFEGLGTAWLSRDSLQLA
jgi:FkbM family methyltransferase